MGATGLPGLAEATGRVAGRSLTAPALLDYVPRPGGRAALDLRIEELARDHGLMVRSMTTLTLPGVPLRPPADGAVIAHLAWGQERPGHYGSWGWRPLHPATYSTGGHSVVVAAVEGRRWLVCDPNWERLQAWPRSGIATAKTLLTGPS